MPVDCVCLHKMKEAPPRRYKNMKQLLNPYEMALLEAAIKEEETTGACMHSYPHHEAALLYKLAQEGDEISLSALKDVLNWWSVYFSCGYEKAAELKDTITQEIINSLKLLEKSYEEGSDDEAV